MTRRVTISVPDDVAEQLDHVPARQVSQQVSQYVTEVLRRRRVADEVRSALVAAGHQEFPFDPAGAAVRLADGRASAATRQAAMARLAELLDRPIDEVRAALDRSVIA